MLNESHIWMPIHSVSNMQRYRPPDCYHAQELKPSNKDYVYKGPSRMDPRQRKVDGGNPYPNTGITPLSIPAA